MFSFLYFPDLSFEYYPINNEWQEIFILWKLEWLKMFFFFFCVFSLFVYFFFQLYYFKFFGASVNRLTLDQSKNTALQSLFLLFFTYLFDYFLMYLCLELFLYKWLFVWLLFNLKSARIYIWYLIFLSWNDNILFLIKSLYGMCLNNCNYGVIIYSTLGIE